MNIHTFYDIIENKIHHPKLEELKKVIDDYPYFTAAAQSYLAVLYAQNQDTFLSELKNNAHLIHNRKFFFRQLKNQRYSNQFIQKPAAKTTNSHPISIIQEPQNNPALPSHQENKDPINVSHIPPKETNSHHQIQTELNKAIADEIIQTEIFQIDTNIKNKSETLKNNESFNNQALPENTISTQEKTTNTLQQDKHSEQDEMLQHTTSLAHLLKQYTQAKNQPTPLPADTEQIKSKNYSKKEKIKQQQDIIDKIISNPPKSTKISNPSNKFFSAENKAKESLLETEDLVTETLAQIYAAQGNIHKAIRAYEILSLKFPQKNIYFAARIEELKNQLKK